MDKNLNITEEDLVKLFSGLHKKRSDVILGLALFVSKTFLLIFVLFAGYIVINFPAVKNKISFWYENDIKTTQTAFVEEPDSNPTNADLVQAAILLPDLPNNTIRIPVLDIEAPINWRVPNTSTDVSKGLENGVIQIDGTSLPGEQGNVYITGHSSNYVWAKGQYNSIFAIIDKLLPGDIIYLKYNDQVYSYKTLEQKVVMANDLSILSQTNDSRLTLVTCWPVGTSYKRLVVIANQDYPSSDKNVAPASKPAFDTLPSAR